MEIFCAAHLRRAGIEVPAAAVIEGEAMCADCFKGKAIRPEGVPRFDEFPPRLDRRKRKYAHRATGTNKVRCPRHPASRSGNPASRTATLPAESNSGSYLFVALAWASMISSPNSLPHSFFSSAEAVPSRFISEYFAILIARGSFSATPSCDTRPCSMPPSCACSRAMPPVAGEL